MRLCTYGEGKGFKSQPLNQKKFPPGNDVQTLQITMATKLIINLLFCHRNQNYCLHNKRNIHLEYFQFLDDVMSANSYL
jgi:hypothetical protein